MLAEAGPVLVFVGPTLAGMPLPDGFVRLPPAAAGDMLAAAPRHASTMVLIDGLFGTDRSPWHKEILHLMAGGHRVIGAASMGALRHAELWRFGMEGAGVIARAYRSGLLVDDGEVAVAHAPAELGFRPLSVALVDVRATLARARKVGVLSRAEAHMVVGAAQDMYFAERSWGAVVAAAGASGQALLAALSTVERQLKREDALAALALCSRPRDSRLPPLPIPLPPETGVLKLITPSVSKPQEEAMKTS